MGKQLSNIVLIGMPGSGKSTAGIILAKKLAMSFVDTDVYIQTSVGQSLQNIVDDQGYEGLGKIEESLLLELCVINHVIATGGSAVYSDAAMAHLKSDGLAVFLDADLATLENRIGDFSNRGLAKRPDQSFAQLYDERQALYKQYADIKVNCAGISQEGVCDLIIRKIKDYIKALQSSNNKKTTC